MIQYQEADASVVVGYFVKGFKPKTPETEILKTEWFFDQYKQKFIFKLYTNEKDTTEGN